MTSIQLAYVRKCYFKILIPPIRLLSLSKTLIVSLIHLHAVCYNVVPWRKFTVECSAGLFAAFGNVFIGLLFFRMCNYVLTVL